MLLKGCLGLIVALISRLVTSIPPMILTLLIVMLLDAVGGGLRAKSRRSKRKWDWDKSLDGTKKRVGALCMVGLAGVLERHIEVQGIPKGAMLTGAAGFYVYHYGLSFINSLVALGVPVPKFMRVAIGRFSGDEETGGEDVIPAKQKGGAA